MSPLAKLYLITCWSYIISFHLTLSILPLDMAASAGAGGPVAVAAERVVVLEGDQFARAAKVQGLKSRAAFKLLQINERYRLFRPGMTVVDLGFAPGSWSQVATDLTKPRGRVLGVDLLPVQPPKGVSTIQGDFLSPDIQAEIKAFLRDPDRGRLRRPSALLDTSIATSSASNPPGGAAIDQAAALEEEATGYLERESHEKTLVADAEVADPDPAEHRDKCADVVLSDMCEPWDPLDGLYKKSISNPYYRLMNTSGNAFRDHAGSMDLCRAALRFSYDTLKVGGHFVCKFYQGAEDKSLEKSLKAMFHKVHREKPESSRAQSKEAYFVGIKRLAKVEKEVVLAGP
ncbi:ribosomal RNA large subunit methyltransferase J [Cladophialophora yegresii CBS 114405]|uniref:rRNA methyltransferase 2, mitochondrial n=1 Tax=Cladophialophora yegresii CBS 114405 TaxID=1182544 RepID=W9VLT1_9EURO|nr:ribosomal RNA large subunit methyltransferase J [Cladophialophora yegresii CBS 114405]EXJ53945.1 ribosomal RNA large subunit methyltransferase J [Cladophialophora yegresii CBS 114405]